MAPLLDLLVDVSPSLVAVALALLARPLLRMRGLPHLRHAAGAGARPRAAALGAEQVVLVTVAGLVHLVPATSNHVMSVFASKTKIFRA